MSALVSAYSSPTAVLGEDGLADLLSDAESLFDSLADSGVASELLGAVSDFELEEESQSLTHETVEQPLTIGEVSVDGEGFIRLRQICRGTDASAAPNSEQNGLLELTMTFRDTGIDPVMWGQFASCLYGYEEQVVAIDGDVNLHVGDSFELSGSFDSPILVQLDGTVAVDETVLSVPGDFQIDLSGAFRFRLPLDDGHVVVSLGGEDTTIDALNGTFTCDLEEGICQSGDTVFDF